MNIPAASDVELDPANPDVVYAGMWQGQEAPWENGAWGGTDGGLFKSTDGGANWRQLKNGLPDGLSQIIVAISPNNPQPVVRNRGHRARLLDLPFRRCGRKLGEDHQRSAARRTNRRRRPGRAESGSKKSGYRLLRHGGYVEIDGRRQDVDRNSRRARRRRLPEYLDQSG